MSATSDPRRRQLFRTSGSLFDSDVYESYTAAYAWASNQAAHMGLGFVAAAAVAALFPWVKTHGWILFIPYIGKESIDLITASRTFAGTFRIPLGELALDSLADASFFSVGVAFLFLSQDRWQGVAMMIGLLLVVTLVFGLHYMPQKRAFDKAGLPYLYRLGKYNATVPDQLRDFLNQFIAGQGSGRCIVIFGKAGSGKTTLAVAIASEFTERQQYALYLPEARTFEALASKNRKTPSGLGEAWTIDEADIVVIDDCTDLKLTPEAQAALKNKRLIWVLSTLADRAADIGAIKAAFGPIELIDVDTLHYKPPA